MTETKNGTHHPETIALHHGYQAEEKTRPAAVPIYQTAAYTFRDTQHGADLFDLKEEGNIYTRIMNPTNAVLEARLAQMEGGVGALAMASGMSAITCAVQTLVTFLSFRKWREGDIMAGVCRM